MAYQRPGQYTGNPASRLRGKYTNAKPVTHKVGPGFQRPPYSGSIYARPQGKPGKFAFAKRPTLADSLQYRKYGKASSQSQGYSDASRPRYELRGDSSRYELRGDANRPELRGAGKLGSGLAGAYQEAHDSANEANEGRYSDILQGRIELRDDVMGRIDGYSRQQLDDVNDTYDSHIAQNQANLSARGLSASTAGVGTERAINTSRTDAMNRVYDSIIDRENAADLGTSEGIYGFMERREDVGPDYNQMARLAEGLGTGGYGIGGYQSANEGGVRNKRLVGGSTNGGQRRKATSSRFDSQTTDGVARQYDRIANKIRKEQQARPSVDRNMTMGGPAVIGSHSIFGDPIGSSSVQSGGGGYAPRGTATPNGGQRPDYATLKGERLTRVEAEGKATRERVAQKRQYQKQLDGATPGELADIAYTTAGQSYPKWLRQRAAEMYEQLH